jgi:hypothetical protein
MTYSDVALVRNVSGLTTKEKSDADITTLISIADELIDRYCEKTTAFLTGDVNYKKIQYASALLVSWMCFRSLLGAEEKAKEMKKEAYGILDNVRSDTSGVLLG